MIYTPVQVDITKDHEAGVYIATSEDLPGLVLESEDMDELKAAVSEAIPALLEVEREPPRLSWSKLANDFIELVRGFFRGIH
ncbi:MAG: DUF1902 domain-containing protein [Gammaproteobacteria bacterium]|nr:DUF1902 domain-containing protein [Gammaproteobacteria bacterium]